MEEKILKSLMKNRKAVSPVIATLLVIAIAVAAAILVYVWSMGLIGSLQSGGGEQVTEQLSLDVYSWNATGNLAMTVRNVGAADVNVSNIYVETDAGIETFDGATVAGTSSQVDIGDTETFTMAPTVSNITPGKQYTIKIVTQSGGTFTYSAIAGSAR